MWCTVHRNKRGWDCDSLRERDCVRESDKEINGEKDRLTERLREVERKWYKAG